MPTAKWRLPKTSNASEETKGAFATPDDLRRLAETQTIRESNRDLRLNRKLRWRYARWIFCYLVCYSAFVALLLLCCGSGLSFKLPESVLNFLVGSTAASAIGLVLAVTVGLFRPTINKASAPSP